jgi:hypothetical protein
VLPLLLVHDRGDVWLLYAVTAIYGFSYTLIGAGQSALLATLLPEDELADANAVLQTVREGLRLVAPLAGAALFTALGGAAVALLDAATFVLAAAAIALMRAPDPRPVPTAERRLAAGARHVRRTIPLRDMTIACAAALLFIGFSETLTFEVVDVGLERDPAFVGVPVVLVALFTLLQRSTPAALQGRVYSAVEVLVGVPQMVSIAAGALLVTVVDYRLLLLVEAAVVAAAGAWLLARAARGVAAAL